MTTPAQDQLRICVVGDELAAGVGDPKGLGWLGRVTARTHHPALTMVFPLAVPGETTTALSARWEDELVRRSSNDPAVDHRVVFALGRADIPAGLSVARSRLNLANMLDVADDRRIPAFVVGPPPGHDSERDRIAELSTAFSDVANRRRVPYVDTFTPLVHHEQWLSDLASNGLPYPGQAGYGLMAWLVLHTGWYQWLGLPDDEV
ncbi:GDSL-type esterase/lipase family protein [Sanguibacter suaedae]|uniref:Lysophospholipase n=1 Tax=Sanguibacter suaedae TaxID=2795737 RepID=A0A934MAW6_9MICO|nr:GDSL-type esterase/lipase family protein [Sanguibacter suaedae]MBI9116050.1 lysophospholipase [Sanguibacter suaedae]